MSEEPTLSERICLQILKIVSIRTLSHGFVPQWQIRPASNRNVIVLDEFRMHFLMVILVLKMFGLLFQSSCQTHLYDIKLTQPLGYHAVSNPFYVAFY